MLTLNKIIKTSGKKEIITRAVYYKQEIAEKHALKYGLTWMWHGPDPNEASYGVFTGSIDNILMYYENELDMDADGIYELHELLRVNSLEYEKYID